jgi:hypothetical protein
VNRNENQENEEFQKYSNSDFNISTSFSFLDSGAVGAGFCTLLLDVESRS